MFGWLKRWFNKKDDSPRLDTFHPGKRVVYKYFDGQKEVTRDPLVLYKKFISSSTHLVPAVEDLDKDPLAVQGQAYDRLLVQLRELFSVKALEEGGLSDIEMLKLFDHFLAFCGSTTEKAKEEKEQLKKEAPIPPPSPPPNPNPVQSPPLPPETAPHSKAPIPTNVSVSVGGESINLDEIRRPTDD